MGYKVYAGFLVSTGEGKVGRFKWDDFTLLYDTSESDLSETLECGLYEPDVELSNSEIGTFTFRVPQKSFSVDGRTVTNRFYNKFKLRRTFVSIIEDDKEEIFLGPVTDITLNFDLSQTITCASFEDLLQSDTHTIPGRNPVYLTVDTDGETDAGTGFEGDYTLYDSVFSRAMGALILPDIGGEYVPIRNWNVDYLLNKSEDFSSNGDVIDTGWNILQSYLFDKYSGYFKLYRIPDKAGDWGGPSELAVFYSNHGIATTEQTIEYGKNLLELTHTYSIPSNFCNHLVVRSTKTTTKGWWIFKKTTVEEISGRAYDDVSREKYGTVFRELQTDSANSEEELNKLAEQTLKDEYEQEPDEELTIQAFDRYDIGQARDRLGYLKKTYIKSPKHGVDGWYVCTKVSFSLDKPDEKTFQYGNPPKKLTSQQNATTTKANTTQNQTRGIISHINA